MSEVFSKSGMARRADDARAVLERLGAAGCRFLQIESPDNNGSLRGKIVPLAPSLFASGTAFARVMLAVKGGGNISFSAPFANTENGCGKIVSMPDLATAVALPWKRDVAGVICDYYMNNGTPCPVDARQLLRNVEAQLAAQSYSARVALETEVYILQQDEALMRQERFAELPSFGYSRMFYSISRVPSFESLAKEFITRCEVAGIPIEAFHTEWGRGMYEYTFAPQTPLKAADDAVRAKLYLKELCAERGLVACYMAAKSIDEGDTCSGCHHNFSIWRCGENVFWDPAAGGLSQSARHAAAALLETMPAFSLVHRPWVNSYRRMNYFLGAPETASWGEENAFVGIRVVHGAAPERMTRFEHRVSGTDINPYLSIASILLASLRGMREKKDPQPYAQSGNPFEDKRWERLPRTMSQAIELFRKSAAVAEELGAEFAAHFASTREEEWNDFSAAIASPELALQKGPVTDWEIRRYFETA